MLGSRSALAAAIPASTLTDNGMVFTTRRSGGNQPARHRRPQRLRGFIQTRLERQFGTAPGIRGTAVLYGAYHLGYGMGTEEMLSWSG